MKLFYLLEVATRRICCSGLQGTCRLADFAERCAGDETITSAFHTVTAEFSKPRREIVFSKVTQFFFKIGVHHECQMFKEKLNLRSKVSKQKTGLRKGLKESSSVSSD